MSELFLNGYETSTGGICAPAGFLAAGVSCGIKKTRGLDLALIHTAKPSSSVALYTSNRFQAAPIVVTREHLVDGKLQAVVINSGNANACTGERGLQDARGMAEVAAQALGIESTDVAIASTGVIGSFLPTEIIEEGIGLATRQLTKDGETAADAILTTDTFRKELAITCQVSGSPCVIGGMAKGAGMIRPDLATMLAFITTDAQVEPDLLRECLVQAVNYSFNMISVDGCMSTNDMVLAMASGDGPAKVDSDTKADFTAALSAVCGELARLIVRDAEGATKFVTVAIAGAADFSEAKKAAMAVADSDLVKTALFGQDANWGRIAGAVGAAGIYFEPGEVEIFLGPELLFAGNEPQEVPEANLADYMQNEELAIRVNLGRGQGSATVWSCDLSYDYVRINADYRS